MACKESVQQRAFTEPRATNQHNVEVETALFEFLVDLVCDGVKANIRVEFFGFHLLECKVLTVKSLARVLF